MDTGNERDDQASTGDSTHAWYPESDDAGWGAPAGSLGDPGQAPRRPVVRSPRSSSSGWDKDPADWGESGSAGNQWDAAAAAGIGEWPSSPEDATWSSEPSGGNHWRRAPRGSGGPRRPQPSPDLSPDDYYGASGRSEPGADPEVWGTSSYDTVVTYPPGDYGEPMTQRRSHFRPPIFPTDPDIEPVPEPHRRRTGKIAVAAVGALALLGGGVAAAVTLGGPKNSPAATSGGSTSLAGSAQNKAATTTGTTTPAARNPVATTTPAATTTPTQPPTTPPTSAAANNLPLGAWTTQELNLILQIKGDLTSLNRDLDPQPNFNALTVDAANLSQDLQAAQSSPTPDNPAVAQEWGQLMQDLGTSNNDLNGAIGSHDPNVAQDLEAPVSATDNDYNNLSRTLNQATRHADGVTGGGGRGH